jgi:hypothetical protein
MSETISMNGVDGDEKEKEDGIVVTQAIATDVAASSDVATTKDIVMLGANAAAEDADADADADGEPDDAPPSPSPMQLQVVQMKAEPTLTVVDKTKLAKAGIATGNPATEIAVVESEA